MRASKEIGDLLKIMAALRTPGTGCPWDLEQTHRSLVRYAIEEAYEVVDAIERDDLDDLRDELGDLLFQVVFHARLAEEAGVFDFGDVVAGVSAKMLRRHPHVFAETGTPSTGTAQVRVAWEEIKAAEREAKAARREPVEAAAPASLLADVPRALPGLARAVKLQRRAASVGFDWGDARLVLAKIREEIDEIEEALDERDAGTAADADAVTGEIGDLIFALANLARHADVDPEEALRGTNAKFERRFAFIERELAARGSSPAASTLAEMDALWDAAKARGL